MTLAKCFILWQPHPSVWLRLPNVALISQNIRAMFQHVSVTRCVANTPLHAVAPKCAHHVQPQTRGHHVSFCLDQPDVIQILRLRDSTSPQNVAAATQHGPTGFQHVATGPGRGLDPARTMNSSGDLVCSCSS